MTANPPGPSPVADATWNRLAMTALLAYGAVLLLVVLVWHRTPLYSVETDLLGEYLPAARDLLRGVLAPEHYQSKAIGYPLALAFAALATGGDYFLGARLLNVAAAVAAGFFAYRIFRRFLGARAGCFVLIGLLVNPAFARATVEAATDTPTMALSLAATALVLGGSGAWTMAVSGLLAGLAVVTRYNFAFLPLAALLVLAGRERRRSRVPAYLAGFAVPVAAWAAIARGLGVGLLGGANTANMAYEIYGHGLAPEVFWSTIGRQFHSLWDVVAYDPRSFASHLGLNLATRWLQDIQDLVPVWLGALAVPGILLGWRRRPGWPGIALHAALCYAVLANVFYLLRFSLYLIPFYLSGAVLLVLEQRLPGLRPAAAPSPGWRDAWRPVVLAVLLAGSAARAVEAVWVDLATAPTETRAGGLLLRGIGRPGERVMARKPHVAYFAGLDYVPLPDVGVVTFADLIEAGRRAGARYLFYSVAEAATRPQFAALSDSGVRLPGLEQLAYRHPDEQHAFTLYRFSGERFARASLDSAVLQAFRHVAARQPGQVWPHTSLAGQLISLQRYPEALAELEVADSLAPGDLAVARMRGFVYSELGDYAHAEQAFEQAIRLGSTAGWERAKLAQIRIRQGRYAEARDLLAAALRAEPGNATYAFGLGLAYLLNGELPAATRRLEKSLSVNPDPLVRLYAARAWQLQGRPEKALAILEAGERGGPASPELKAMADSLRAELRSR